MQDFENAPSGASRKNPEDEISDAVQAELIVLLEELRKRFDIDGRNLGWAVHLAVCRNIRAHEGDAAWLGFNRRLVRETNETLEAIDEIIREDARDNGRMN